MADLTLDEVREKVRTDPLYGAAFLRERSRRDFSYFCREILGYKDMIAESQALLPGYSHESLCQLLQHDTQPFKLILMPRYTFKSHVGTIGYALWQLANDPNLRLLICSDTNEKAEGFLGGIKNHIHGQIAGSLFRAIFGAWEVDPKRGVWNQQAIVVAPRNRAQVEPSIDTAGIETSKTGKHYDIIIFDDLVSEKNITTPELMQKVKEVYRKYLSVLKPGGTVLLIGTRWHHGDLYGTIVAEEEERAKLAQPPVFRVYKRQAEVTTGDKTLYPFSIMGPQSLTKDRLQLLKTQQGSAVFSALYQNDPTDDKDAKFKLKDFAFYDPALKSDPKWLASLFITCCLDPIPPSDSLKGDDAALTVVGSDDEMNMYLLDAIAGRLQPSEQIDSLFLLYSRWKFRTLGIEDNHWQKTLLPEIEIRVKQNRQHDPNFRLFLVESLTRSSTNSKHRDIHGLQPYHERQAIKFPGTRLELLTGVYQKLSLQMQQYPNSAHDDVLDSLSMHLNIQRPGERPKIVKEYPVTSAAWFEREVFQKQELKSLQRVPRWRRPSPTPLAFS